ncbi:MAG: beta-phosphoglucomutase-like phosphatase (HAD superfamily) [Bacteriovoracaceae bacterium]|jgi:beta-phosphoglucomutase-like phosphatase (HAD superfamily)
MSNKDKFIVFGLEGIFIDTQNILLKTFKDYMEKKFPINKIEVEHCAGHSLIQLFEEIKFEEFFLKKYPKLQMQKSLNRESENVELRRHIRNINYKICEELQTFKVNFDNISKLKILKSEGKRLALYSSLDAIVTFTIVKHLKISDYFEIILTRNDVEKLPPDPECINHLSLFFGCKVNDISIISSNPLLSEMATLLEVPCKSVI